MNWAEWVQWFNHNWLNVVGPILLLVAFWVGGQWIRNAFYQSFGRWAARQNHKWIKVIAESTRAAFFQWFFLLGCQMAVSVSILSSVYKYYAGKIILSLFIISLTWTLLVIGENIIKRYIYELRAWLSKIGAPQPSTILLISMVRVPVVVCSLLVLLFIWGAPDITGILIIASTIFLLILWLKDRLRNIRLSPFANSLIKLFLVLLIIAVAVEVIHRGYVLFIQQSDVPANLVILIFEMILFIWLIWFVRHSRFKWIKPSFKLIILPLLGLSIILAFSNVQPFGGIKDTAYQEVQTFFAGIKLPPPTLPASSWEETINRVEPSIVRVEQGNSIGSGIIVSSSGYVLTNDHVVDGTQSVIIKVLNIGQFQGEVVKRDKVKDLALVRLNAPKTNLMSATIGDSSSLKEGAEVVAIGYSLGIEGTPTISKGIVSAIRQDKDGVILIQTDTSINPGNSGGALINRAGEIIGIPTWSIEKTKAKNAQDERIIQQMNFAVAINEAKSLISDLPSTAIIPQETDSLSKLEKDTFNLINVERNKLGIAPVTWNESISVAARKHSQAMQEQGNLYHDSGGQYAECCYGGPLHYSSSSTTAEGIVAGWMSSPGHKAIILDGQYRQGAIGIARDKGFWATYRCY